MDGYNIHIYILLGAGLLWFSLDQSPTHLHICILQKKLWHTV